MAAARAGVKLEEGVTDGKTQTSRGKGLGTKQATRFLHSKKGPHVGYDQFNIRGTFVCWQIAYQGMRNEKKRDRRQV